MNQNQQQASGKQALDNILESAALDQKLSQIKYKIVVLSGKGGVGKSTTATNLAMGLALNGRKVGLLDIDFHGPSIPKLMGMENQRVETSPGGILPLTFGQNLKVMSLGLLLQSADDAVIWRGPLKMGAIKQLIQDVEWGTLDYLIIDSPPGTGDEPLSVVQILKKPTGAVVVTQPQDLSVSDVRRSIRFCEKLNLPVLGVIENMSGFVCPHCGATVDIFKTGGGEKLAADLNVPFLGRIPIDPTIVEASDAGKPFVYFQEKSDSTKRFNEIIAQLIENVEHITLVKKEETQPMSRSNLRRYAIPTANGKLCMHFGHCDQFAIIDYDLNENKISQTEMKTPPPHEPGLLPRWLHDQNVSLILASGMGQRAQSLFESNGIEVVTGVIGDNPAELVAAHVKGTLEAGDNVCDH